MVENIFRERARKCGRRCVLERREIHEAVQDQVSELEQNFHSQSEIQVWYGHVWRPRGQNLHHYFPFFDG